MRRTNSLPCGLVQLPEKALSLSMRVNRSGTIDLAEVTSVLQA
jgi:hypothetical protein